MATLDDKLSRIVSKMQERSGLANLVPASKAYQLAQSCAYEQMQLENQLDIYAKRNSITGSTGTDLDTIGNGFFGVARRPEVLPFITVDMKTIKFYVKYGTFGSINTVNGSPADIIIPEGTVISGGTKSTLWKFRVSAQTTLNSGDSECFVGATILQGPSDIIPANVLTSHNFTNYTDAASMALLVTNISVIGTGRAKETDENYRYRISTAMKAFPKTNYYGIYDLLTGVPGISEVYVDQAANGGGTCTFYIQGISPITSDTTVDSAKTLLDSIIPPWVNYSVTKPNYIGMEIIFTITTRQLYDAQQSTTISDLVIDKLSTLVNNFFGAEFLIQDITKYVMSISYDITSCVLAEVNTYVGPMDYRTKISYNVTDPLARIYIAKNEKLIMEPKQNPIIITVTQ